MLDIHHAKARHHPGPGCRHTGEMDGTSYTLATSLLRDPSQTGLQPIVMGDRRLSNPAVPWKCLALLLLPLALALDVRAQGSPPATRPFKELPRAPTQDHTGLFEGGFRLPDLLKPRAEDNGKLMVHGSITVLGETIAPGTFARLSWKPQATFESIAAPTPVLVVNGAAPGPTLCLTGAVHGDEINGIEIIRQVFFGLRPEELAGAVIGVPIVNQQGFRLNSRYLPDRRDLNRYFPGDPTGSSASRIAFSFFNDVVRHCDALVDLHTGSFHRTNVPQLRADMTNEKVTQLVHGFGGMIVLHNPGARGSLRRAAVDAGVPTVTLEAGEPMRIQADVVEDGVERILTLMTNMGIYKRSYYWSDAAPVYLNSRWVRTDQGGLLISKVEVGDKVKPGDLLGKVVDPINNLEFPMHSPFEGQVIGMALNQVVMPGYAVYHIGIAATEESLEIDPAEPASNGNGHGEGARNSDLREFD
ncbi:MAG TPA: succinylglutamate desuccinylase/aspartoacylase family protein [Porticoccaceae bacterium]|nr:succinylglutamate desuccinylase/aspartoacylase family protein [Porticoccaceae bacterium]